MTWSGWYGWWRLVIFVIAACGGGISSRPPSLSKPSFTILDQGAEPRQQVRYQRTLHAPELVEIDLKIGVHVATTTETAKLGLDAPTVRVLDRVEVVGFDADGALVEGRIESIVVLDDVAVAPATRRKLETEFMPMVGMRSSWHESSRGVISDVHTEPRPRGGPDWINQVVRRSTVELPEEAIGIGARWQVEQNYSIGGISWSSKVTHSLTKLTDSVADVDFEAVASAAHQPFRIEPGSTWTLESGIDKSSGHTSAALHGLAATGTDSSTVELNVRVVQRHGNTVATMLFELAFATRPHAAVQAPGLP